MTPSKRCFLPALVLAATAACSADNGGSDGGVRRDAQSDGPMSDVRDDGGARPDINTNCTDTDHDNISDLIESVADNDHDGTPNAMDDDSDGDGFSDLAEGNRNYPGYEAMARPALTCGAAPDNCDDDEIPNFIDLDSDNDGLSDAEEVTAHTNPCNPDTDGDMVPDLTEVAAMSDPTSATSLPPTGSLYVTLPYSTATSVQPHVHREFEFQTRIRAADVFFLVDTTGSMQATIDTLRTTLTTRIIPGVAGALSGGDARYGMGDFRDLPNGVNGDSADWILRVRQRLDASPDLARMALTPMVASGGGDWPEAQVEAMVQALEGPGIAGHESDRTPALGTGGGGWAGVADPARDCSPGPDEQQHGWACFTEGRVPILVLFSDADWHNGALSTYPYTSPRGMHSYGNLRDAMIRRGAYFVGIDVGQGRNTFVMSDQLSRDTSSLDGAGNPIVFNNPGGGASIADSVVMGVTTLASQTRQNITTRTQPDAAETRIAAGHSTADFVTAVVPLRGVPDMPVGYQSRDATTFFNVLPSTRVVFDVDFYNDFQPPAATAQLFRATIIVLGRAGSEVDRRPVFIIVPGENANTNPG